MSLGSIDLIYFTKEGYKESYIIQYGLPGGLHPTTSCSDIDAHHIWWCWMVTCRSGIFSLPFFWPPHLSCFSPSTAWDLVHLLAPCYWYAVIGWHSFHYILVPQCDINHQSWAGLLEKEFRTCTQAEISNLKTYSGKVVHDTAETVSDKEHW